MLSNALTDTTIKQAIRAVEKSAQPRKLFDGKGLFLLLKRNGSALWRFKYVSARTADGRSKDNSISFGAYPEVPLKRAREKRDAARAQAADGIDPSEERKKQKIAEANSFAEVAEEYIANQEHSPAKRTVDKARWQLREFVRAARAAAPDRVTRQDRDRAQDERTVRPGVPLRRRHRRV
jgi:hypothetical protein